MEGFSAHLPQVPSEALSDEICEAQMCTFGSTCYDSMTSVKEVIVALERCLSYHPRSIRFVDNSASIAAFINRKALNPCCVSNCT